MTRWPAVYRYVCNVHWKTMIKYSKISIYVFSLHAYDYHGLRKTITDSKISSNRINILKRCKVWTNWSNSSPSSSRRRRFSVQLRTKNSKHYNCSPFYVVLKAYVYVITILCIMFTEWMCTTDVCNIFIHCNHNCWRSYRSRSSVKNNFSFYLLQY